HRIAAWLVTAAVGLFGTTALAQTPTPAPSPKPLHSYFLLLKRPGEIPVLPSLGTDVWRFRASLSLPTSFDPDHQSIELSVMGPPTLENPDGDPHIRPFDLLQLLPRGRRWTMAVS